MKTISHTNKPGVKGSQPSEDLTQEAVAKKYGWDDVFAGRPVGAAWTILESKGLAGKGVGS